MSEKAIQQKQVIVNEIVKKIENAKSVTLVEFDKMDVKEITDLRNNFRDANTEYKVYKNTMMRFAFQQLGFDQFTASMLVNTLQAPIRKLAGDLSQINAKLVYALDAVREKKENEAA